jgi:hypothetical protein
MPVPRSRLIAAALLLVVTGCGGRGFGRQYEYEEQLYLDADGSAAIVLNASIPALMALRGLALDPNPRARIDRNQLRQMVTEPGLSITRVSRPWRRAGRQFIQIRAEIDDVRRLKDTKLFGWSVYDVTDTPGNMWTYRQLVGTPAAAAPPNTGWDGSELVAFKLHLPSKIEFHNVRDIETNETLSAERGNILTWEQRLGDRLAGRPVEMVVTMQRGSILYRTLGLFAASFAAAIVILIAVIWMVIRRGKQKNQAAGIRS